MSVSNGMPPVHPGEVLYGELEELDISASALADALAVPVNTIAAILKGENGITANMALRLSRYFSTSPEFWMNLQKTFELRVAEIEYGNEIAKEVKPRDMAGAFGS